MNSPIKNKVLRTCISFLFIVHILILIKFILLKNPGNYIPLYTVKYYLTGTDKMRYTKENLAGNVFLFFPLGIFFPLLFNKANHFQRIILISFFISLAFELIQLFTILGNFDTDDIILNVLGAALGLGVYLLITELIQYKRVHSSE